MESGRESLILQQTPPMPSETQRPRVEAARTPRWSLNAWLKVRSQLCSPNFLTPPTPVFPLSVPPLITSLSFPSPFPSLAL